MLNGVDSIASSVLLQQVHVAAPRLLCCWIRYIIMQLLHNRQADALFACLFYTLLPLFSAISFMSTVSRFTVL